jgi:hypothetical protein
VVRDERKDLLFKEMFTIALLIIVENGSTLNNRRLTDLNECDVLIT